APAISLSAPRGRPPVSVSSAATPVETVSGAARSRSNSVEERCSPSEDSMRARSLAADGIRTSGGRSGYRAGVAFAFYSPTDEILLRGTKVVNPSAKAARKAELRNSCERSSRNWRGGVAVIGKLDGRRDGIPSAAPPLVSCRRQTSSLHISA